MFETCPGESTDLSPLPPSVYRSHCSETRRYNRCCAMSLDSRVYIGHRWRANSRAQTTAIVERGRKARKSFRGGKLRFRRGGNQPPGTGWRTWWTKVRRERERKRETSLTRPWHNFHWFLPVFCTLSRIPYRWILLNG